jgi:hypothetical protein
MGGDPDWSHMRRGAEEMEYEVRYEVRNEIDFVLPSIRVWHGIQS